MKKSNNKYLPLEWIASMFLLVILMVIILWFISDKQTKTIKEDDMTIYFVGMQYDYTGRVKLSYDGKETVIKAGKENPEITLKDQIIIANKGTKLITPNSLIYHTGDPTKDLKRVNYFSEIYKDDENHLVVGRDNKEVIVSGGFLYNGADLYVFLEDMDITIGNTVYSVKPLSYAVVRYQKSVELYSSEDNSYMNIAVMGNDVFAESANGYKLNLSTDLYTTEENDYILFSGIDKLESIN